MLYSHRGNNLFTPPRTRFVTLIQARVIAGAVCAAMERSQHPRAAAAACTTPQCLIFACDALTSLSPADETARLPERLQYRPLSRPRLGGHWQLSQTPSHSTGSLAIDMDLTSLDGRPTVLK